MHHGHVDTQIFSYDYLDVALSAGIQKGLFIRREPNSKMSHEEVKLPLAQIGIRVRYALQ